MPLIENYEITLSDNGRALWTFELADALGERASDPAAVDWLESDDEGRFSFDAEQGLLSAQFPRRLLDGSALSLAFSPLSPRAAELAREARSFLLCPARDGQFLAAFEMPRLGDLPPTARADALPARKFGGAR